MSEESADREYERFIAHRDALLEVQKHNIVTYDKAILTLASGAFGISIIFMDKLGGVGVTQYKWLLAAAWVAYLSAILCNLSSYRYGWREARSQMQLLDERLRTHQEYAYPNPSKRSNTELLNEWSFRSFAIGTIALCTFAYLNIGDANERTKDTFTPSASAATSTNS